MKTGSFLMEGSTKKRSVTNSSIIFSNMSNSSKKEEKLFCPKFTSFKVQI